MKKILSLFLLLFSLTSFAQSLESEFLYYSGRNFGRDFNSRVSETRKVLDLAERVASERGIFVKKINLKARDGSSYPALEILAQGSSEQNLEAAKVSKGMGRIPLVFSPYDLSFGSNAFFDPNGSKIGVPYRFFIDGANDSSYLHELYHAETYKKVMTGQSTIWAGVIQAKDGKQISKTNSSYYFRFASLDEIAATALSVQLDTQELSELQRTLSARDFNRSRGEADQKLGSIYFSTLAGKYLARQTTDVVRRSLQKLREVKITRTKMTLGRDTREIYAATFLLDSYSREFSAGRGVDVAHKDGTEFTLYAHKSPTLNDLEKRLNSILLKAEAAGKQFEAVEKTIYVLIEYPQLERTDLPALYKTASGAFKVLN